MRVILRKPYIRLLLLTLMLAISFCTATVSASVNIAPVADSYGGIAAAMTTVTIAVSIESCDVDGILKDDFMPGEPVYAKGTGFIYGWDTYVRIYVVPNGGPYDLEKPPLFSIYPFVELDGSVEPIFIGSYVAGEYDIWVDRYQPLTGWNHMLDLLPDGNLDPSPDGILPEPVDTFGPDYGFSVVVPTIESCDVEGTPKDDFMPGEPVFAKGTGFMPVVEIDVWIYVVPNGGPYDLTKQTPLFSTPATLGLDGSLEPIFIGFYVAGEYDIWVDREPFDGVRYPPDGDAIIIDGDLYLYEPVDTFGLDYGFFVVPEYPLGTILGLAMCFAALAVFKSKNLRIHL